MKLLLWTAMLAAVFGAMKLPLWTAMLAAGLGAFAMPLVVVVAAAEEVYAAPERPATMLRTGGLRDEHGRALGRSYRRYHRHHHQGSSGQINNVRCSVNSHFLLLFHFSAR